MGGECVDHAAEDPIKKRSPMRSGDLYAGKLVGARIHELDGDAFVPSGKLHSVARSGRKFWPVPKLPSEVGLQREVRDDVNLSLANCQMATQSSSAGLSENF